jgi:hypothetical protein
MRVAQRPKNVVKLADANKIWRRPGEIGQPDLQTFGKREFSRVRQTVRQARRNARRRENNPIGAEWIPDEEIFS